MRTAPFIQLLRPADWLKNLLVFAALVFSGHLAHLPSVLHSALAFVAFCLLASGFYAINDALDVGIDRLHPVKRRRPVAAGTISPLASARFGAVLVVAGVGVGFIVNIQLGMVCGLYVLLQFLYNVRLKRVLLVDVVALSLGFVLRAAAGAAAIDVQISIWLVLGVFFLCLYLGFIKRLADVASVRRAEEGGEWHSPAGYDNRRELNWLLAISASLAIMTYLMYTLSEHTARLFGARAMGFALLAPLVVIAVHRFYLRASLGKSDRPIDAVFEDRAVQASVVLFGLGIILSLYMPYVDVWLERLFLR